MTTRGGIDMYQPYFDKFLNMTPYLEIGEEEWEYIKQTFSVDDVKESMAVICMTYPIPYNDLTEEDAYQSYMDLKGIRWNELLRDGEWFYRSTNSRYELSPQYFSKTNVGSIASNYFQQENRWEANSNRSPGPSKTWRTKKNMITLMGSLFTLKVPRIDKGTLRGCLHLRKYTCSQFRPSVAKALYDKFEAKTVLDFSMGWGDRLAGFYAGNTTEHYVGLDPKVDNHPLYNKQRDFYDKHTSFFENDKRSDFYAIPAEEFNFNKYDNYFDMVFTSPPYYNVEHYSQDDTQSFKRYKSIDDWNTNFLHNVLTNLCQSVKLQGVVGINIADVFSTSGGGMKRWLEITNPMNDHLQSLGMKYIGAIGMEMSKRPNSAGAGMVSHGSAPNEWTDDSMSRVDNSLNKIFCEPIWLWRKV
jgi:hypothetical protein